MTRVTYFCEDKVIQKRETCGCDSPSQQLANNWDVIDPTKPTTTIVIPIVVEGQILFSNVIPDGHILANVYVEGFKQLQGEGLDYLVSGQSIDWISHLRSEVQARLILQPYFELTIEIQAI